MNQLIWRISCIDEDPYGIEWILRDGIWMPNGEVRRYKLCDLICVYYDRHASAIELKGSKNQKRKAMVQCKYGERFAREVLGIENIIKKGVYYSNKGYDWERFG